MDGCEVAEQVTQIKSRTWIIGGERDDGFSCRDERVDGCTDPQIKVNCHRDFNAFQSNAHHVSYLAKSEVDSKGVHHVGDSGWKAVIAFMDSGSAECVAPETIARNILLMETEASRTDVPHCVRSVIKNKGEKTVTMCSEDGDQIRARYQITDVTRPLNSISRVCDQGNNVLFAKTGGSIINHETGRYTWFSVCGTLMVNETFFEARVLGFCDSDGHVEPAVSARPRWKTHESNSSLNVVRWLRMRWMMM